MNASQFKNQRFKSGKTQRCAYCNCVLTRASATVDHVLAKAMGGRDKPRNYVLACEPCNRKKGARSREEFSPVPSIYDPDPWWTRKARGE